MLLSMTGFGEARYEGEALTLSVEVRTLNNRHLKISVRGSDPYPMLEPELEKIIRRHVRRGTVLVQVRSQRRHSPQDFRIDRAALRGYLDQVEQACEEAGKPDWAPHLLGQVLALPGVVPQELGQAALAEGEWRAAEETLEAALRRMQQMRREEGRAMTQELLGYRGLIAAELEKIRARLPEVTEGYRQRLHERINLALQEFNLQVEPEALIREVALFADRSDVAEEVVRLASHLDQFEQVIGAESDSPGRKLEFVTQEMFREANTIGSKASDVAVSRHVVEIKAVLEKIRELLQNIE